MTPVYQNNFLKVFLLFIFSLFIKLSYAQPCTGIISTFPYIEGFEAGTGNWNTGGTASDWVWGTPAKTVINSAGGGTKSWITGGLTGSSYNNGENSWLQSPCFDLTGLQYPQISFKVFWEMERQYDGASMQYSTNGGTSWSTLGSINSNTNCQGENWFNTAAVTFLSNVNGWSGNIQPQSGICLGGNGSIRWLTAKHNLSALAGQSNVRFRFLFGAGTTCNAFNGFAIDDIQISEAPPNVLNVTSTCTGSNDISFLAIGPCIKTYAWDFGDQGSATNTSTAANPVHHYNNPGTYTVTVTAGFETGAPVTQTLQVSVIGLQPIITWPGACSNAADATLTVIPSGTSNPYFYNWSTNPPQTGASITNVGAGTYTVTVSAAGSCGNSNVFTLTPTSQVQFSSLYSPQICGNRNGKIDITTFGGARPFSYLWTNGSTTEDVSGLTPGDYSLEVTDANGCKFTSRTITIGSITKAVNVDLGPDINICPGQSILISPGTFSEYLWQDGSTSPNLASNAAGTYYVQVKDGDGCVGSDTVLIKTDCSGIYFPSAFTPNGDLVNEWFGPVGNILTLKEYRFSIFNRYGERMFFSNDPSKKWDGTYKGVKPNTGSFVWMADYILNGQRKSRKGTVMLIR